jgi:threonine dehydratase
MPMTKPTVRDINEARDRIRRYTYLTPCARSDVLSRLFGCELYLKLENLQVTGSFKERGALNKILQLAPEQRAAGVIAASAGNHAQGVAHAATLNGIASTVVMPETTPLAKIESTRSYGARVILHGASYDDAYTKASELQAKNGYTFVHAFDDPDVIAGQGTIGLELLEQVPDMDLVLVPVGGGGLIGGIALALSESREVIRIVGVEAERMPAMRTSVAAGRVTPLRPANSIADGISVARVGENTLPLVQSCVDDIVTVSEDEIARAVVTLLERKKTLAEGSGAVGLAAMTGGHVADVAGRTVVIVVSGGNIDMTMLARILERGLEHEGRLAQLRIIAPDTTKRLAELAAVIAEHGGGIMEMSQNRSVTEVDVGETEIDLRLETRGKSHVEEITASLRERGFRLK